LPLVAQAVWNERCLKIRYRRGGSLHWRKLHPLGLVLKGGYWYLVAERSGSLRAFVRAGVLFTLVLWASVNLFVVAGVALKGASLALDPEWSKPVANAGLFVGQIFGNALCEEIVRSNGTPMLFAVAVSRGLVFAATVQANPPRMPNRSATSLIDAPAT
jgi:hypothetical protein